MPAHARAGSGSLAMPPVPGLRSDRGENYFGDKEKNHRKEHQRKAKKSGHRPPNRLEKKKAVSAV